MYLEGVFVAASFNYANYNIEFLVCQYRIQRILWGNKRLYVCTNVTLLYYVKYTKEIKMVEYNPSSTVAKISLMLQRKNKTRAELSEFCGISRETIYQSAASKNGLNAKVLLNIAEFLDCPVDYLLGREGYMYDLQKNEVVFLKVKTKPSLMPNESELLKLFQALPESEKYKLLGRLEVLAEQNQPKQETV